MKEFYKGYTIEYLEVTEVFEATIGQSSYDNSSLSAVKKYIDNLEKKDFKRVGVIINDYSQYRFGIITSCVKSNHYGGSVGTDCWISLAKGHRMKKDIESVYLDNKENRAIIGKIIAKKEEIDNIQSEIRDLQVSFEKYTYEIK